MATGGDLSERARGVIACSNLNAHGSSRCGGNLYHPDTNPQGIISLGTAVNKLCHDIISAKISSTGMPSFSEEMQYYFDYTGIPSFRKEIAEYMTRRFKSLKQLDPNNIVVLNGGDVILEGFAFCVAEAGEGILVPAPFYAVITSNFGSRAKVVPVPVFGDQDNAFLPTMKTLEKAYMDAEAKGIRIRGLLIVNPHNPTGIVYPKAILEVCLNFAKSHGLHVCVDEIYALSVFDEGAEFVSVLSMDLPDPDRTHVLYGFSKDLSMPGFRIGILHSTNATLLEAFNQISYFQNVPAIAHKALELLIRDEKWLSEVFFPTTRSRLKVAHSQLTSGLQDLGIPYVTGHAGFFIWADFRQVMKTVTTEAELQLWYFLMYNGVFINCGQAFVASEPGWFRIIFAVPTEMILLALERLAKALEKIRSDPSCLDSINVQEERKKGGSMGYF